MSSDFDRTIDELQKILWAPYPEEVIDHANEPRNVGRIENADGFARIKGFCGDTIEIWLKVKDDRIADIRFLTDGCGPTIAAGSMITELARGKSTAEVSRINPQDVLDALGGLPEENVHCAILAADTLKDAIKDYRTNRDEPWKRAYRKQACP